MADTNSNDLPKKSTLTELLIQALKEGAGAMGLYNPQTNMPSFPQGSMLGNAQGQLQQRPGVVNNAVDQAAK